MESRFNYTVIGAFVLFLGAALVGIVFWLYGGGQYDRSFSKYYAFFDESVSGLNVNAPVRYRGVAVGRVAELGLAPDGSGRVRLVLSLDETAPLREDTVATLRMQGLTGLAQVELSGGAPDSPPLKIRPPHKYPVIATRPSLMTRLDTAVSQVLVNINKTAENINALTDPAMRASIKRSFANLESMSHALAEQMPALQAALQSASASSAEVGKIAKRLNQTAGAVEKMADDVAKTSRVTREVMADAQGGLHQISGQTLPEFNAMTTEMRDLAQQLKQLSNELQEDPSALVYGRVAPKPGPGE